MTTADVELCDLRLLVKVAELGGLSAAARVIGIPKTTATRQLQRLERTLGCRLVHRAAGRSALTEDARSFLPGALDGLAAIDKSVNAIQAERAGVGGLLRIAAPYTFGRKSIGPLLPRFLQDHPSIDVFLTLGSSHANLLADEADIAVRIGKPGDESLIARRLSTEHFAVCASPSYLATRPLFDLEDLTRHRFLDLRPDPIVRELTFTNVSETRRIAINPIVRTNEPEIVIQAALQGAGVAIIPISLIVDHLTAGRLVTCLDNWRLPSWEVNALYAPGRGNAPRVRAFLDYLIAHLTH